MQILSFKWNLSMTDQAQCLCHFIEKAEVSIPCPVLVWIGLGTSNQKDYLIVWMSIALIIRHIINDKCAHNVIQIDCEKHRWSSHIENKTKTKHWCTCYVLEGKIGSKYFQSGLILTACLRKCFGAWMKEVSDVLWKRVVLDHQVGKASKTIS